MKQSNNHKIVLLDIDDTLFNTEVFKTSDLTQFELFDEVPDALFALSEIATLGILSQGTIELQTRKLKETNILSLFHKKHTHIVKIKLEEIQKILKLYSQKDKIFFVEDWLNVLHAAKQHHPSLITIWMKRGRHAPFQKEIPGFKPDYTVKNLEEVVSIVSNS